MAITFKEIQEAQQRYLQALNGSGAQIAQGQVAAQQLSALQAQQAAQAEAQQKAQEDAARRQYELQKEQYKAALKLQKAQYEAALKQQAAGGKAGSKASGNPLAPSQDASPDIMAQIAAEQARRSVLSKAGDDAKYLEGTPTADYLAIQQVLDDKQRLLQQAAEGSLPPALVAEQMRQLDTTAVLLDQQLKSSGLKGFAELSPEEMGVLDTTNQAINQGTLTGTFKNMVRAAANVPIGIAELAAVGAEGAINGFVGTNITGITAATKAAGDFLRSFLPSGDSLGQLVQGQKAQEVIQADTPLSEKIPALGQVIASDPGAAFATGLEGTAGLLGGGGLVNSVGQAVARRVASGTAAGVGAASAAQNLGTRLAALGQRAQQVAPRTADVLRNAGQRVANPLNLAGTTGSIGAAMSGATDQILADPTLTQEQKAAALQQAGLGSIGVGALTGLLPAFVPTAEVSRAASFALPTAASRVGQAAQMGRQVASNVLRPVPGEALQEFVQGGAEALNAPAAIASATGQPLTPQQYNQAIAQGVYEAAMGAGLGAGRGVYDTAIGATTLPQQYAQQQAEIDTLAAQTAAADQAAAQALSPLPATPGELQSLQAVGEQPAMVPAGPAYAPPVAPTQPQQTAPVIDLDAVRQDAVRQASLQNMQTDLSSTALGVPQTLQQQTTALTAQQQANPLAVPTNTDLVASGGASGALMTAPAGGPLVSPPTVTPQAPTNVLAAPPLTYQPDMFGAPTATAPTSVFATVEQPALGAPTGVQQLDLFTDQPAQAASPPALQSPAPAADTLRAAPRKQQQQQPSNPLAGTSNVQGIVDRIRAQQRGGLDLPEDVAPVADFVTNYESGLIALDSDTADLVRENKMGLIKLARALDLDSGPKSPIRKAFREAFSNDDPQQAEEKMDDLMVLLQDELAARSSASPGGDALAAGKQKARKGQSKKKGSSRRGRRRGKKSSK
jgi:hypothetical protein